MQTGGYYCGQRCIIVPATQSVVDMGLPDDSAPAPDNQDGTLHRYGNVIIANKSKKKFTFESNEAALLAMRHAVEYNKLKG
ncbi:hypothetical protein SEA_GIBBLES_96 [Gordonia phage Gibbles]|nr:hypothetical protein SEA_GIBBLES_96 [Gordonia phage Gibbles]